MSNLTFSIKEWVMLILLSVLWGGSFLFNEIGLTAFPPLVIVTLRVTMAAGASYIIMRLMGDRMPDLRKTWPAFLVLGFVNNIIPTTLIVWGQQYVLGGVAAILNATTPLFTLMIAHIFTQDEKITFRKLLGLIIAFLGVATVIGIDALLDFSVTSLGQIAILGAACSYGCAGVYGRRLGRMGIAPMMIATGQLTSASLLLLPVTFWQYGAFFLMDVEGHVWLAMFGLAVLSTALAYLLYFRLITQVGATNAALVTILIPVSAIFLTWSVLGEALPGTAFSGMVIIAIGFLVLDGRLLKRLHKFVRL